MDQVNGWISVNPLTAALQRLALIKMLQVTPPHTLQGTKILIVENDSDVAGIFAFIFRDEGAEVKIAASICDAVNELKRFKPNIVTTEMTLPDGNAYSLLEKVKSFAAATGSWVPVVTLPNDLADVEPTPLPSISFQDFFKSFNLDQLIDTVVALIGHPVSFS